MVLSFQDFLTVILTRKSDICFGGLGSHFKCYFDSLGRLENLNLVTRKTRKSGERLAKVSLIENKHGGPI